MKASSGLSNTIIGLENSMRSTPDYEIESNFNFGGSALIFFCLLSTILILMAGKIVTRILKD